jgi:hypothetical protein
VTAWYHEASRTPKARLYARSDSETRRRLWRLDPSQFRGSNDQLERLDVRGHGPRDYTFRNHLRHSRYFALASADGQADPKKNIILDIFKAVDDIGDKAGDTDLYAEEDE